MRCRICKARLDDYYYVSDGKKYCSVACAMKGLEKDGKIKFGAPYKDECFHCKTPILKTKRSGLMWDNKSFCDEGHLAIYLATQGVITSKGVEE